MSSRFAGLAGASAIGALLLLAGDYPGTGAEGGGGIRGQGAANSHPVITRRRRGPARGRPWRRVRPTGAARRVGILLSLMWIKLRFDPAFRRNIITEHWN